MLPNKINILGAEYTIEYLSKDEDMMFKSGKADGYCDQTSKRIVLRTENEDDDMDDYKEYLRRITRHEIVHAFLYESGLGANFQHSEWGHDETMVDWIAFQFPKLLKAYQDADCL